MPDKVNVICILMDSMNRHFLPIYGNQWMRTPNIDRLAKRSVIFDQHYMCSAPCMPARHDIFTGWGEFLWRPWGSVEPYDSPLPTILKRNGVVTQLVTDHYHLFERGGENYHIDFEGWELIRGHENDPWVTGSCPVPEHRGQLTPRYNRNMSRLKRETDFFSARTFQAAADWIEDNHDKHDSFFLMIDEFDPHEPFHVPPPYDTMYDDGWGGPLYFWETYGYCEDEDDAIKHIRAQYAGKLTMADRWLGRLLDKIDDFNLWDNTVIILMTDHGHYLGEHGLYGKPPCPQYQTFAHLPLLIHLPDDVRAGEREQALTSNVDIYATILDAFGLQPQGFTHSRSLLPLARGETNKIRDFVLYGYFGEGIGYCDGHYTYLRSPLESGNKQLYMYSQRWSTAPWWAVPPLDDKVQAGRWMPGSDCLLFRREIGNDEMVRIHSNMLDMMMVPSKLFNIDRDEVQEHDLAGGTLEREYMQRLRQALREWNAPGEQLKRLSI